MIVDLQFLVYCSCIKEQVVKTGFIVIGVVGGLKKVGYSGKGGGHLFVGNKG